jgi:hypothetical protein
MNATCGARTKEAALPGHTRASSAVVVSDFLPIPVFPLFLLLFGFVTADVLLQLGN